VSPPKVGPERSGLRKKIEPPTENVADRETKAPDPSLSKKEKYAQMRGAVRDGRLGALGSLDAKGRDNPAPK